MYNFSEVRILVGVPKTAIPDGIMISMKALLRATRLLMNRSLMQHLKTDGRLYLQEMKMKIIARRNKGD